MLSFTTQKMKLQSVRNSLNLFKAGALCVLTLRSCWITIYFKHGIFDITTPNENIMKIIFTVILIGITALKPAQAEVSIVAYSTDTSVYPLDNDSTVFNPGVSDSTVQRLLNKYQVWRYKRPFWRDNDTMSLQIIISCHGDIFELADSLWSTGKYYELYVDSIWASSPMYKPNITKVFPNPASEYIELEFTSPPINVSLLDLHGKLVLYDDRLESKVKYLMDASSIESGTYIIRIKHGDGTITTSRVAIVHL